MNTINRIRIYHAALAVLAILAYLTGELGIIHAWLGYGIAIIILIRLLWALSGDRQVGLMRFYPSFDGLKMNNMFTHPVISKSLIAGIALSLILVTATGIIIDRGKAVGFANVEAAAPAHVDNNRGEHEDEEEGLLAETHEFSANLMLLFVGLHVIYLLMFKLPLAKFMLFVPKSTNNPQNKDAKK